MKVDVYGRYQLEVLREDGAWIIYRLDTGKRVRVPELAIPADLEPKDIPVFLDDLYHEMARPGQSVQVLVDERFIVLYRWKLRPGSEKAFVDAWSAITSRLFTWGGSLGSRLHHGADGIWYAYAQWPSEEARRQAFKEYVDPASSALMQAAVLESLPEVVLEPVAGYLV